jgi:putative membrane protein
MPVVLTNEERPVASPPVPIPTPAAQVARGFAMGAADIVPGVSGGTVALVLGIYERLIQNVHAGAQALKEILRGRRAAFVPALKQVEWVWLVSLLVGVLSAVAVLSSIIEDLLHDHPVRMSGLFFGLVAGSVIVAWRLIKAVTVAELAMMFGVALVLFLLLGLRSETEAVGEEIVTRPWWVFLLAGALAICAMILPGISGSFILVMIGMYTEVLGAVNDRDLLPLLATAVGCVVGLALFSSLLSWLLDHHHDLVIAAMIGLMLGSLRVLWPWPGGTNTTDLAAPADDVGFPILLALVGFAVVISVEIVASRTTAHT